MPCAHTKRTEIPANNSLPTGRMRNHVPASSQDSLTSGVSAAGNRKGISNDGMNGASVSQPEWLYYMKYN
jgi:hypothetical protein